MVDSSVLRKVRKRLKNGENLDKILNSMKKEGLVKDEIAEITHLILSKTNTDVKFSDGMVKYHSVKLTKYFLVIAILVMVGVGLFIVDTMHTENQEKEYAEMIANFNASKIFEPIQKSYTGDSIFSKNLGNVTIDMKPVAIYEVNSMVLSTRDYRYMDEVLPFDVMIAWGDVARLDFDEYIKVFQKNHFGFFEIGKSPHFTERYAKNHTANTHIIPATSQIQDAILLLEPRDIVKMKGYLVNIAVNQNGQRIDYMETSTVRTDDGNGACEIFLVNEVWLKDVRYAWDT